MIDTAAIRERLKARVNNTWPTGSPRGFSEVETRELCRDATALLAAHDRMAAEIERLRKALTMAEVAWAGALANHHGGTPAEQREPVLNCIRAALSQQPGAAAERGEGL